MQRRDIERWLSRRGLPQLIEGYGTERSIDTRVARWLIAWLLFQVVLICWTADVGVEVRLVAIAVGVVGLVAGIVLHRRVTGRDLLRPTDPYNLFDIALFGLFPAVVGAFRFRSVEGAAGAFFLSMEGVLLIYLLVGFGLFWILAWSIGWLASQLPQLISLAARTLPLVLILVIFLLFASELWLAAAYASLAELLAVTAVAAVTGLGFLGTRVRADVTALTQSVADRNITADVRGTPAEGLAVRATIDQRRPLARLQRVNVGLVLLISQTLQTALVSLIVFSFLLVVGLLLAPAPVQEAWVEMPIRELLAFEALDERRVLSQELLVVATLLSTFAGVYFAGFALDDERYRAEAVSGTVADLRRALAVRDVYVGALEGHPDVPPGTAT